MAHLRQSGKPWNGKILEAGNRFADVRFAGDRSDTEREEHESQSGCQLVAASRDHEIGKDHIEYTARDGCGHHSDIRIAGFGGGGETRNSANEHDTFETKIHDAGSFADNFADGRIKYRSSRQCSSRQHAFKERGAHASPAFPARAARTTNKIKAIRMFTAAAGRFCVI